MTAPDFAHRRALLEAAPVHTFMDQAPMVVLPTSARDDLLALLDRIEKVEAESVELRETQSFRNSLFARTEASLAKAVEALAAMAANTTMTRLQFREACMDTLASINGEG